MYDLHSRLPMRMLDEPHKPLYEGGISKGLIV